MSVSGSPEANNRRLQQAPGSAARRETSKDRPGKVPEESRSPVRAPLTLAPLDVSRRKVS